MKSTLKLAILSGKGGVGKTTVTVNLAYAFRTLKKNVGVVDMDITGPNVVRAMGIEKALDIDIARAKYLPVDADGIRVLSMANILPRGKALIWEGARRQKLINEFINAADWTGAEILLADLPPGVGDETLSMVQYFAPDGAVVVTTPHSMAQEDYLRIVDMLAFWKIPVIKTVVNMAYFDFKCPHPRCGKKVHRVSVFSDTRDVPWGDHYDVPFDPLVSSSNRVDLMDLAAEILQKMVVTA